MPARTRSRRKISSLSGAIFSTKGGVISRRDFYEQRAPFRPRESGRHYHRLLQRAFAFFIPPNARVLEIGCGTGDLLATVKPSHGVGVDFSPAMVALAKQRHPQFTFHVADAAESGRFDRSLKVVLRFNQAVRATDVLAHAADQMA